MFGYNNGPRASPVVDGDRVYIVGPEGMLHCVRRRRRQAGLEGRHVDGVRRRAKLLRRRQHAARVGRPADRQGRRQPAGQPERRVRGRRPRRGQRHGRRRLRQAHRQGAVEGDRRAGQLRRARSLPTIDGRRWCFVFARGGLVAFDPRRGKVDFHFPWRARKLESVNASNPVVVGDQVFISEALRPRQRARSRVKPRRRYKVVWQDETAAATRRMESTGRRRPPRRLLYGSSGRHTRRRRAALRRAGDRQGEVARAGLAARRCCTSTATSSAWARTAGCGCSRRPEKYESAGRAHAQRRRRRAAARNTLLGGAGAVPRTAVRARQGPAGVPGTDSRRLNQYWPSLSGGFINPSEGLVGCVPPPGITALAPTGVMSC